MNFNIGDILQHEIHVELNGGKFDPMYPTVFVKEISKDGKTIMGVKYKKRYSTFHKDYTKIKIGESFTGCNDLSKFYVKILTKPQRAKKK